jgi:regulator of sigma E protease
VLHGSGAEAAGIKKGDRIKQLDGSPVYGPEAVYDFFESHPAAPVKVGLVRDGKPLDVTLTPVKPIKPEPFPKEALSIGLTGISFENPTSVVEDVPVYLPPGEQLITAATMMRRTFGAVFGARGDVGFQQMGGPVKIFSVYYSLFTSPDGWKKVLWFSVVLNVNLALMNLIPFPVFDGGHIVMALGEMVRRKSILPLRILEKVQMACVILLLFFFCYVTWFDTADLLGPGQKKDKEPPFKIEDIQYSVK